MTHHAGGLHSLTQTGSVWFAPKHVTGEISGTLRHDESESVDVLSHTHERQETHPALRQHLLILGLEIEMTVEEFTKCNLNT